MTRLKYSIENLRTKITTQRGKKRLLDDINIFITKIKTWKEYLNSNVDVDELSQTFITCFGKIN